MRRPIRFIASTIATTIGLTIGLGIGSPAHADEWLYVLASKDVRVLPGSGDNGRIVLKPTIDALQFTDRPQRRSADTTVRSFLRDFAWDPVTGVLDTKAPNAAVAIDGDLTQSVEIRRAKVTKDKVTLYVRGLDGPLAADRGPGAVFVDDAGGEQSTALSSNVAVHSTYNTSAPSVSITFTSSGDVLWSGTLTPAAPSLTVPQSSGGGATISGTVRVEFGTADEDTTASFSGTVVDNGQSLNANSEIGSWSPNS